MQSLELKIPPPAVLALFALAMWGAATLVPSFTIAVPAREIVAVALGAAGVLVSLAGVLAFRKAKTTINPLRPDAASSIVTTGIYGRTRNPMYLGMLLVLLGWAAYLSNLLALALVALFVAYIGRFQIAPEERILHAKFGASFARYMMAVRRWI